MEVIKTEIKTSPYGGKQMLHTTLKDGSIWESELNGKMFRQLSPDFVQLETNLKNQQKND